MLSAKRKGQETNWNFFLTVDNFGTKLSHLVNYRLKSKVDK